MSTSSGTEASSLPPLTHDSSPSAAANRHSDHHLLNHLETSSPSTGSGAAAILLPSASLPAFHGIDRDVSTSFPATGMEDTPTMLDLWSSVGSDYIPLFEQTGPQAPPQTQPHSLHHHLSLHPLHAAPHSIPQHSSAAHLLAHSLNTIVSSSSASAPLYTLPSTPNHYDASHVHSGRVVSSLPPKQTQIHWPTTFTIADLSVLPTLLKNKGLELA